jgi:urate oxidase
MNYLKVLAVALLTAVASCQLNAGEDLVISSEELYEAIQEEFPTTNILTADRHYRSLNTETLKKAHSIYFNALRENKLIYTSEVFDCEDICRGLKNVLVEMAAFHRSDFTPALGTIYYMTDEGTGHAIVLQVYKDHTGEIHVIPREPQNKKAARVHLSKKERKETALILF